jgi:hypothetical protein
MTKRVAALSAIVISPYRRQFSTRIFFGYLPSRSVFPDIAAVCDDAGATGAGVRGWDRARNHCRNRFGAVCMRDGCVGAGAFYSRCVPGVDFNSTVMIRPYRLLDPSRSGQEGAIGTTQKAGQIAHRI